MRVEVLVALGDGTWFPHIEESISDETPEDVANRVYDDLWSEGYDDIVIVSILSVQVDQVE